MVSGCVTEVGVERTPMARNDAASRSFGGDILGGVCWNCGWVGVSGEEWGRDDVRNPVISVLSGLCIQGRERRLDV